MKQENVRRERFRRYPSRGRIRPSGLTLSHSFRPPRGGSASRVSSCAFPGLLSGAARTLAGAFLLLALGALAASPARAQTPVATIAAGTSPVTEGTRMTFTVSLSRPAPAGGLQVPVTISESTGSDFVPSIEERQWTIRFLRGHERATLNVRTVDDSTAEPDGQVTATLGTGDGYTVGTANSATVTVYDNDGPLATIAAGTSPVTEGTAATFTVSLDIAAPVGGVDVNVTVSEAEGSDFVAADDEGDWEVPIVAGQTSATFSVPTVGDSTDEPNGSVTARVTTGDGYRILISPPTQATVAVHDNDDDGPPPGGTTDPPGGTTDPPGGTTDPPSVTIDPPGGRTVTDEGGSVIYTIAFGARPSGDVTVTLASADESVATVESVLGAAGNKTLTFTPSNWSRVQEVLVRGVNDNLLNPQVDDLYSGRTTTITHGISGGGYGHLTVPDIRVTVVDDDRPALEFSSRSLTLAPGDRYGETYYVSLAAVPSGTVTVELAASESAVTLNKSSLTFTAAAWNVGQEVHVRTGSGWTADSRATIAHTAEGGGYDEVAAEVAVSGGATGGDTGDGDTGDDDETADIPALYRRVPRNVAVSESGLVSWTLDTATEPEPYEWYSVEWVAGESPPSDLRRDWGDHTTDSGELWIEEHTCDAGSGCRVQIEDFDPAWHYLVHVNTSARSVEGYPAVAVRHTPAGANDGGTPPADGESGDQDTPGGAGSGALTGLSVEPVAGDPTRLTVSWDAVEGAARYDVRWKTGSGDYGDAVEASTNSHTVTGLSPGTTYTVNVAALDGSNVLLAEGEASGVTADGDTADGGTGGGDTGGGDTGGGATGDGNTGGGNTGGGDTGGGNTGGGDTANPTVTHTEEEELPDAVALLGNYPNPFNPQTRIDYELPSPVHVRLAVYDMQGRLARVLENGVRPAGRHTAVFDAGDLPGGAYAYRLETPEGIVTKIMTLVK